MQTTLEPPPLAGRPLNGTEIRQRLADCRRLVESGLLEAAAVLLWSAFEAAVRASLTELGRQTEDPITISRIPAGLVTQAVAYGVIDPEDRDALLRFLPVRDAAAHGYAEAIDTASLQEIAGLTERTLGEMGRNEIT